MLFLILLIALVAARPSTPRRRSSGFELVEESPPANEESKRYGTRDRCTTAGGVWRQTRSPCSSTCAIFGRYVEEDCSSSRSNSNSNSGSQSGNNEPAENVLQAMFGTRDKCQSQGGRWNQVRGRCGSSCTYQGSTIEQAC